MMLHQLPFFGEGKTMHMKRPELAVSTLYHEECCVPYISKRTALEWIELDLFNSIYLNYIFLF